MADATSPPARPGKRRIKAIDVVIIGLVAALVAFVVYRVDYVLHYNWNWPQVLAFVVDYDEELGAWVPNLLLTGLLTSLRLAFWGLILASLIGLVMGLCRTSQDPFLRLVSRGYVELIRNIPPLVFIFTFYFFISSQIIPWIGLDRVHESVPAYLRGPLEVMFGDLRLLPNFASGLICLTMFEGAYITEIVRAGIQSIDKGQWEAGRAVGLSRFNVLRDVILPQAMRRILPPLAGQFITLIKDSAIVSLISIQELTFLATEVAATTTRVFETWIVVGAMYFVICYAFAWVFGRMERRMNVERR